MFPNCRLFRETDPVESSSPTSTSDFENMVLFCRKAKDIFDFRQPTESDCLGSQSRRMLLKPRYEIPLQDFVGEKVGGRWNLDSDKILRKERVRELKKWHAIGAARHWRIMRTVMPDIVWERW